VSYVAINSDAANTTKNHARPVDVRAVSRNVEREPVVVRVVLAAERLLIFGDVNIPHRAPINIILVPARVMLVTVLLAEAYELLT
jgi:hypothetical protein